MKRTILALSLLVASCGGGQAPTITHATIVRALQWACAAINALPADPPTPTTSGGETAPQ